MTELIFCAGGNKTNSAIALRYGFSYGAKLPSTLYYPLRFADQEYQHPRRRAYMHALKKHRPALATVLDWDANTTKETVFSWAAEAAWYVPEVIIIPKIPGTVGEVPDTLGKATVRLGYSVPTSYGKTDAEVSEFGQRPVHLLGGHPVTQYMFSKQMNALSVDGNFIQRMAGLNCWFSIDPIQGAKNKQFPMLKESGYGHIQRGTPYFAFELSCLNWRALWAGCPASIRFALPDDIPAIKRIAQQYRNEVGFVNRAALLESMKRRNLLVAVAGMQVVGFVNYRACRDGWQTVYEIAVNRDYKGQCIGAGLLAAVPQPIRLKCTVDNPANAFYEAQGFTSAGTENGRKRELNIWHLGAHHEDLQ